MDIAIISHVSLGDIKSGQQKRIYDLVRHISQVSHVKYYYVGHQQEYLDTLKELSRFGVETLYLNNCYSNVFIKTIVNLLYIATFPLIGIKKSWFISYIATLINKNTYVGLKSDIVISEYYHNAIAFKYIKNTLRIIDMHDMQFVTLESYLNNSIFRYLPTKYIQMRIARWLELRYINKADAVISVNNEESKYVEKYTGCKNIIFCPLTINGKNTNLKQHKASMPSDIKIAYFSNLSSARSYNEVLFLVTHVAPELNRRFDNKVTLYVVGNNPSEPLVELCKVPNVVMVGRVDSIEEGFKDMHFLINYWEGRSYGFRTRVIDALSTGTPVLTTRAGIDGMGLDLDKCVLVFESIDELAEIINRYVTDESAYNNACQSAYEESLKYDSAVVYAKLNADLNGLNKIYNDK